MSSLIWGSAPRAWAATTLCLIAGSAALCLTVTTAAGEPVRVRFTEGVARGFPVIRDLNGQILARGEFSQVARDAVVESRMTFRFKDGSLYDETTVFAQAGTFKLLRYALTQRGPSFPETIHATLERQNRQVQVRYKEDNDSPEEVIETRMELPADLYNGMLSLLLKNLDPGRATVSILAFTPRPTVVKIELNAVGDESMLLGDSAQTARRWTLRPQLGMLASLLVSDLPDMRFWMLTGGAPAFLRFEGPLYFMGPVWRIDWN
jgi:hypothetical protein